MDFYIVFGVLIKKVICILLFEFCVLIDLCKCWWMVDCGCIIFLCGDKLGLFVWNMILFFWFFFKFFFDILDELIGFVYFFFFVVSIEFLKDNLWLVLLYNMNIVNDDFVRCWIVV